MQSESSSEGETLRKPELQVYTIKNLPQSNREQIVDLSLYQSNSRMNDSANLVNIHSPSHNSSSTSHNFPCSPSQNSLLNVSDL